MREIKFRAWKPHNSLRMKPGMYPVSDIVWYEKVFQGKTGEVFYRGYKTSDYLEDIKLMQCTGLKDKNGVEIYKGDLLRWIDWQEELTDKPDIYRVDWLDREARFSLNCFRDGRQLDPKEDMLRLDDEFEVIGNIYENPELLEAKS